MIALFVQTLLLMGAAYFVGAAVACLVRRSFHATTRPQPAVARPVEPLPEMGGPARFGRSSESQARPAPALVAPPVTAPSAQDLKRIRQIDPEAEAGLNKLGVHRYEEIAAWMQPDVKRISEALGLADRISRENWIEQAQILSRGGDTAFSRDYDRRARGEPMPLRPAKLADAIREHSSKESGDVPPPAKTDLASLRSVRSAAYQNPEPGPEAAQRAAAQSKVLRSAPLNDLKRIRGIGVLIEKKLNQMGVVAYEQIANWTAADVDRVSQSLDFKGRIERENWVEQARILASGGATEFSRRVDRGEVETNRYRP